MSRTITVLFMLSCMQAHAFWFTYDGLQDRSFPTSGAYTNYANYNGVWSNSVFFFPFTDSGDLSLDHSANPVADSWADGAGASKPTHYAGSSVAYDLTRYAGNNDYIYATNAAYVNMTGMTFNAWIVGYNGSATWLLDWSDVCWVYFNSTDQFYFRIEDDNTSGAFYKYVDTAKYSRYTPQMLTVTWDGTTFNHGGLKIYINGEDATGSGSSSGTTDAIRTDPRNLYVGSRSTGGQGYTGQMSVPSFYNRALTPAEIGVIYTNTRSPNAQNTYEGVYVDNGFGWSSWLATNATLKSDFVAYCPSTVDPLRYTEMEQKVNETIFTPASSPVFTNHVYYLDGNDDGFYIQSTWDNRFDVNSTQGCFSFWIKQHDTGAANGVPMQWRNTAAGNGTDALTIGLSWSDANKRMGIDFYDGAVNQYKWRIYTTNNWCIQHSNEWTHVFVNHDGTEPELFVNGIPEAGAYFETSTDKTLWYSHMITNSADDITIGYATWIGAAAAFYEGYMGDFFFGTNAWTTNEVLGYYNATVTNLPSF